MKKLLTLVALAITSICSAQNISGLYSGTLFNDTTGLTQNYEIALSEYKGKITGYSYTTFVVNDTFYYGIRRVKAFRRNNELIVEDDKLIVNNFPTQPTKGVKKMVVFPLQGDSIISLAGRWETNRTKQYYPITGNMKLKRDNDSSHSALIGHLTELKLIDAYGNVISDPKIEAELVRQADKTEKKVAAESVVKAKQEKKEQPPIAVVKPRAEKKKPVEKQTEIKAVVKKEEPVVIKPLERKTKLIQTVEFSSDSIVLSLYDNGVVDGDVVSVYVDDVLIIDKIKITERAYKQTIALNNNNRSAKLTLVAENLGSLPPNTGLLIVQDGSQKHNVLFSADMQTNASIILQKK